MTLLWEIDPATVTLDAGTVRQITTAGPVFTATTGQPGLPLIDAAGRPALELNGASLASAAAAFPRPASGAFAVRLRIAPAMLADPSPTLRVFAWQPNFSNNLSLEVDEAGAGPGVFAYKAAANVWRTLSMVPALTDGGFHTYVIAWTPTTMTLHCDGDEVGSATFTADGASANGQFTFGGAVSPAAPGALMYAAFHDGVVDPVTLTASIDAMFAAVDPAGTAALSVDGTGTLLARDLWDVPDPPTPTGDGGNLTPPPAPPAQSPPTGVPAPVVRRRSEVMPAPVLDGRGFPVDWEPTQTIVEDAGVFQVVVEGTDITYLHDAPVPTPSWARADPFGPASATITLPQVTAFHTPGAGTMAWCRGGANVEIRLGDLTLFEGVVISFGHDEQGTTGTFTLTCLGSLYQADLQLRKPAFVPTPQDMGSAIKTELDDVVSRRYASVPTATLGIATSVRGGWEPKLTGRVQQLLATALTGGNQWTVTCVDRAPLLVVKDTTTVHWHVSNGQRGVGVSLSQDWSQAPNVIYGEGIAPDGGRWRNSKYPNWRPDDTPPYPFTDPGTTIRVGVTDAITDTGNGVSLWQSRVGRAVTGVFATADRSHLRWMQGNAGIQVDGILGPQSWAMSFATGSNTGTLDGAWIAPLADSPTVRPRLHAEDGADQGPNGDYDTRVLRVERYLNFGEGVTKDEGRRAAAEILARDMNPGWTGTITLTLDPEEGSRFEMLEGQNVAVRYWRGNTTLLLHIAAVEQGEERTVLTVDTNARDFPTLDSVRARERDAVDPARAYISPKGRSHLPQDMPTFDSEAGGGLVPRHALFANLWTVIRIPVAAYGRIVRTDFQTSGATPFALALFDRPVTAAQLLGIMGNPLTAESNPWNNDDLDEAGLLMGWGWTKQPAGYSPGFYSDPDGEGATPPTGRLVDDGTVEYSSRHAPWLWVAEIATASCFIEGRFWPGAD